MWERVYDSETGLAEGLAVGWLGPQVGRLGLLEEGLKKVGIWVEIGGEGLDMVVGVDHFGSIQAWQAAGHIK